MFLLVFKNTPGTGIEHLLLSTYICQKSTSFLFLHTAFFIRVFLEVVIVIIKEAIIKVIIVIIEVV